MKNRFCEILIEIIDIDNLNFHNVTIYIYIFQ